jgi:LysM repeat protein
MKLQLPKLPQILKERPDFLKRKPAKSKSIKLNAATARMRPGVEDDFDDEPQTRLSSAFFVVLILHVVAVGGIYAFNSIKAHRRGFEPATASTKAAVEKSEPAEAPSKAPTAPATTASVAPVAPTTSSVSTGRVYHVKSGDTLQRISASMNVTVAELQFLNNAKDLASLRAGQVINLPAKKAVIEPPMPNPVAAKKPDVSTKTAPVTTLAANTYTVKSGDTATSIAKRSGVSVDELLKLNKVSDPKKLQLGQTLKLPAKKN